MKYKNSNFFKYFLLLVINISLIVGAQELSSLQESVAAEMSNDPEEVLIIRKAYHDVYFQKCTSQIIQQQDDMKYSSQILERALNLRGLDKEFRNSILKGSKLGWQRGILKGKEKDFNSTRDYCNCIHKVIFKNEFECGL